MNSTIGREETGTTEKSRRRWYAKLRACTYLAVVVSTILVYVYTTFYRGPVYSAGYASNPAGGRYLVIYPVETTMTYIFLTLMVAFIFNSAVLGGPKTMYDAFGIELIGPDEPEHKESGKKFLFYLIAATIIAVLMGVYVPAFVPGGG